MAENIFQSIRGAQFRGSRFPGFRSTGQQADSGVDPVTAEFAAQSGGGSRPSTGLNAQSFGGADFSASTAPAGAPAPDGGSIASAVGRGIDSITPNVSTTGGIVGTASRGAGLAASAAGLGPIGAALSLGGRAVGEVIDAENYNDQLEARGLERSVSAGRWQFASFGDHFRYCQQPGKYIARPIWRWHCRTKPIARKQPDRG